MERSTIKSRIKNLLRSPSTKLKRNRQALRDNSTNKLTLERVLGITTSGSSGLTCDPCTGTVAYPAGCVVVLLNPKTNKQQHIINTSRKAVTTLAFSSDGKYLVTGENGHQPAVRVWDVADGSQAAELQEHKYGVACVTFSPNSKYIVSVGCQHDMSVNVWAWKKNMLVAANKVSSKVTAVSFSDDSSYFVTAGHRHVRFWYLELWNKTLTAPVPLLGRSGILGELQNNFFCDVACGRGEKSESTFCITSSGLLCEFNEKRMLDKWVDLRALFVPFILFSNGQDPNRTTTEQTNTASGLSVTEDLIFCACADGKVRVFSPSDLQFICTLPLPHHLGTDVTTGTQFSHLFSNMPEVHYPDSVALTYDPVNLWLSCVYNDHSLYVWDVQDLQKVGKVHSALYHSACVWDLQMYPKPTEDLPVSDLSSELFLTCSADNTIRMWSTEGNRSPSNALSSDLQKVIYMDSNTACLLDTEGAATSATEKPEAQTAESRTGIRTICVSPDGSHLASGDRTGTLRVHDLHSMEEILKAEVHDSEILCLEYSKPETGMKLLATAGRDRLIHILDAEEDYGLLQTLDEHSSSITAVRFAANDGKVKMISCGADKSVYFRTAHRTFRGVKFKPTHHVVRKSTLNDMDVDSICKYAVVGCQDRSIRVFNISSGKQKKSFKGSQAEDGGLLRVQMDPSGQYVATSCSDKNLSLFHLQTGECLASMFGHSEIITGIKFTSNCRHLISASADSCVFIWTLAPELTVTMKERLDRLKHFPSGQTIAKSMFRRSSTRSLEQYSGLSLITCSSESEDNDERFKGIQTSDEHVIHQTLLEEDQGVSEEGNDWDSSNKESSPGSSEPSLPGTPSRRKQWNCGMGSLELMVKSMPELQQLDSFSRPSSPRRGRSIGQLSRQARSTASMDANMRRSARQHVRPHSMWLAPASSPEPEGVVLYPVLCPNLQGENMKRKDSSTGYGSGESSQEQDHGGSDDPEPLSTDEEHYTPEEEEEESARGRPFHQPKSRKQESFLREPFGNLANNTGNDPVPQGSISASFFNQAPTTRSPSQLKSKSSRKSERSRIFHSIHDTLASTYPRQKGMGQVISLNERAEETKNLPSTPKWRKAPSVKDVARPLSRSGTDSPIGRKSANVSQLKKENKPPPHEILTDKTDSGVHLQYSSLTSCPSPQPSENPNSKHRHLKMRSYMSPTTSFKAKVSRSFSLGEGPHLNLHSGQSSPSSQSPTSSSSASTPIQPYRSTPLPGPSNPSDLRVNHGECQTRDDKTKSHVLGWMSNPVSEYPSWSTSSRDTATSRHSLAISGEGQEFLVSQTMSANDSHTTLSYPPQQTLLGVQTFDVTKERQTYQEESSVDLETCRQAASDLYGSVKKATQLYRMVNTSVDVVTEQQQEMKRVLMDALLTAQCELQSVSGLSPLVGLMGSVGGERTLALLEQYSQLLLQAVERRLEHKN